MANYLLELEKQYAIEERNNMAKGKFTTRLDTLRQKWVMERDGVVVATFPYIEGQLADKIVNAMNERRLDVV